MFTVNVTEAVIVVAAIITPALPVDDHRPGEGEDIPGDQLAEVNPPGGLWRGGRRGGFVNFHARNLAQLKPAPTMHNGIASEVFHRRTAYGAVGVGAGL
jgi:hypothetical protein